jgi:hypothetical protein
LPQTRATIHDERLVVSPQPIRGFQEPCARPNSPTQNFMANHCQLASSSEEPHTLGQELDRASKPTVRYNSPAEDPNTSLVYDDSNIAFVELSQTMNANLEYKFKSLEHCATIHDMKPIVQVASPSYETCHNPDLPTREESRTPSNGNNCCSPTQPTPSMQEVPSGSPPMPSGKWGSGRVGGCEGLLQIPPSPSTCTLPLGSSLMPNSKWGSRKEGGGGEDGEEKYPPPSPNSDDANDENTGANHSKTRRWDMPPTHHGRPVPTKHPTDNWRYHNSNRGGAMTKMSMMSQGAKPSPPKSSPLSFHAWSHMTKSTLYSDVPTTYRGICGPWRKPSRSTKSLESACDTTI